MSTNYSTALPYLPDEEMLNTSTYIDPNGPNEGSTDHEDDDLPDSGRNVEKGKRKRYLTMIRGWAQFKLK